MKKTYICPEVEVVALGNDVIATSGFSTDGSQSSTQTLSTGDTGGHRLIWD